MPGSVNRPVVAGNVEVEAGDWIVGDVDGVVVVPRASVDDVLASAQARTDKEARLFDALNAGKTTIELLGLDPSPITVD
jgi:4-hydroxy-4-methyl-2-oxoglutarate aldolase